MVKPHKHSELIKAWADGAAIQCKQIGVDEWVDIPDPSWDVCCEYRIKPIDIPFGWWKWDPIEKVGLCYNDRCEGFEFLFKDESKVFIRLGDGLPKNRQDIIAWREIPQEEVTTNVIRWQWIVRDLPYLLPRITPNFYTEKEAIEKNKAGVELIGKAEWTKMEFNQ